GGGRCGFVLYGNFSPMPNLAPICGSRRERRSRRISKVTKRRPLRAAPVAYRDERFLGDFNARFSSFPITGRRRSTGVLAAGDLARSVADHAALHSRNRSDFRRSDLLHGAGLPKPWLHVLRNPLRHEFGPRGLAPDAVRACRFQRRSAMGPHIARWSIVA